MINHSTFLRSNSRGLWDILFRERLVLLLLASTFAVLGWQRWGMNRLLFLNPQSAQLTAESFSDHEDGGISVCSMEQDSQEWRFIYDVRSGKTWAFCGIRFKFRKNDKSRGFDLSNFDTLVVNLAGVKGPRPALQTQIKSMDTNIYRPGETVSLKYNVMVLSLESDGPSRTPMPLSYFIIPAWWVARNHVPIRLQFPDRSDVRELEFVTAEDVVQAGRGTVRIRNLEFHGKWIDKMLLFKILLAAWISYIMFGLALRLYRSFASIRRLQQQSNRLQELAERDPLTQLHNRRGLENSLSILANRCLDPENKDLGVAMIDLDHFKNVNDTLGHDAGDEILRLLAKIIREEMRPNNLAARWGGEEFILLFPGISTSRLHPAAEKIRARIEADLRYGGLHLTASIGIAHGRVEEFHLLEKRADEALYRAKANGRNRVEA